MMITKQSTPKQIINNNGYMLHILKRYEINYKDKKSIADLGQAKNFNVNFLVDLLNAFDELKPGMVYKFDQYEIPVLLNYLKRSHKYYLDRRLPEIIFSMLEVYRLYPALSALKKFIAEYTKRLEVHFIKEDEVLFPYAEYLYNATIKFKQVPFIDSYFYEFSVKDFLHDHHTERDLQLMRLALEKHNPSNNTWSPYRITLELIKNFEEDLKIHALIEDRVLIPRMINIEQRILATLN
jgi:regulator of cell morphogenesis and NO signaling